MSRKKQLKSIDDLIQRIMIIAENQCSLSDEDSCVLSDVIIELQQLKRKKGKTNKQIQETFSRIAVSLLRFFEVDLMTE